MNQLSPALKLMTETMSHAKSLGIIHGHFTDQKLNGQTVNVFGRDLYHFASCSYLGLELDPRLKEAGKDAIDKYGSLFSCSRTYLEAPLYGILEEKFQQIFDKPCVVVGTTSLGHISWIPNAIQKTDAIIMDQQVHRSVQNASLMAKGSGSHLEVVRHNRMDLLEDRIIELSKKYQKIWYMADGVYSMFGDVAPMQHLYDLMDKYEQFYIYVDDAHGMSWAGKHGRGFVLNQVNHHHPKMCLITSLCKGFGSNGGVMVFGDEVQKALMKFVGSTLVFSSPVSPAILATSIASADIHLSGEIYERQNSLQEKMQFFVNKAREIDVPIVNDCLTPIFYVGTGVHHTDVSLFVNQLQQDGFFVNASSYPIVPMNNAGLRITLNINHDTETITNLLTCIKNRMDSRGIVAEEVRKVFAPKALANA
jgi:7-keto-8-aminopelargonate synthetase-like enzyme